MSNGKKAEGIKNRKGFRQENLPGTLQPVAALENPPRRDDSKPLSPSPAEYEQLIGRRLKGFRTSRRWPLKRVAFELSVTVATVSDWEHGIRFPSGGNLILLSRLFGVSPCQLICAGRKFCPMCKPGC
jgi:DNA-binding transcriptional regulator YiaG